MRTLIVGDVHGCADELNELVCAAAPDRVVLVGDLFTKGPDPVGVLRQIRTLNASAVLGNHDERLLRYIDGDGPDDRVAAACARHLDREDRSWRAWLRALPLFLDVAGFTVVHAGLHPSGDLIQTTRAMALNMRRFPDRSDAPFWHEVYTGDRRVVFGHDARRGLVRVERDGAAHLVGLDSGCVYGGALSGYLPEEDRVLQVPAARQYKGFG